MTLLPIRTSVEAVMIDALRRLDGVRVSVRRWGGDVTMEFDKASEFEIGEVYWLHSEDELMPRPRFRRRARVTGKVTRSDLSVTVSFVQEPNPPTWSLATDPESRQLRGL